MILTRKRKQIIFLLSVNSRTETGLSIIKSIWYIMTLCLTMSLGSKRLSIKKARNNGVPGQADDRKVSLTGPG